jgi:hypothetical protein
MLSSRIFPIMASQVLLYSPLQMALTRAWVET